MTKKKLPKIMNMYIFNFVLLLNNLKIKVHILLNVIPAHWLSYYMQL